MSQRLIVPQTSKMSITNNTYDIWQGRSTSSQTATVSSELRVVMRISAPECAVSMELPSTHTWSLLSVDRKGSLWGVATRTADHERCVFSMDRDAQRILRSATSEVIDGSPWPCGRPLLTLPQSESSGDIVGFLHSQRDPLSWTWLLMHNGSVYLLNGGSDQDGEGTSVLAHHRLAGTVTACAVSTCSVLVAMETETAGVSEVVQLLYSPIQPSSSADKPTKPRMRANALFRLGDSVERLCVLNIPLTDAATVSDSILEHDDAPVGESARRVLATVTRRGNIDTWDLATGCDASEHFGTPQYDAASLGVPTCAAGVDGTLWVGTSSGALVVFDLLHRDEVPTVLHHHPACVQSMVVMSLGRRLWTSCADGSVTVWSTTRRKPYGVFEMQHVPVTHLTTAPRQMLTHVWGVDEKGRGRCWEVRELVSGSGAPQEGAAVSAAVENRDSDVRSFVAQLCGLLTGRQSVLPVAPAALDSEIPEARFLGDALTSLMECRTMICETFGELGWSSVSLSEDVRTLTRHAKSTTRSSQRAGEVAQRLSELTPAFPLPRRLDPVDQLLMAAECVLEEIQDQGVIKHPHFTHPSPPASPTAPRQGGKPPRSSLDDSLVTPPEAESLSQHIFETQLRALQEQLDKEQRASAVFRERVAELEAHNEKLQHSLHELQTEASNRLGEVDRYKNAAAAAKRRVGIVEEQLERTTTQLREALTGAQTELATLKRTVQAQQAEIRDHSSDRQLLREVLSKLEEADAAYNEVRTAACHTADRLQEQQQEFQAKERSGRALIRSLKSDRGAVLREVQSLRNLLLDHLTQTRTIDIGAVLARLAPLERVLSTECTPPELQDNYLRNDSTSPRAPAARRMAL